MNTDSFMVFYKKELEEEMKLMTTKGEEYCKGNEDRLNNFKSVGAEMGLDPMKVWAVYFKKHVDSIINYVKCGEVKSNESIESRFRDARNYLTLGLALIEEKMKHPPGGCLVTGNPILPF